MVTFQRSLSDVNGHALVPMFSKYLTLASFYVLVILTGVTVVTWPWQGFVTFMEEQRVPYTFLAITLALLITQTYLHLRLGRGEIGINYYFTREKMHQEYLPTEVMTPFLRYGLPRACLQIVVTLLPSLPIVLLATVVSGFSLVMLLKALSVIVIASLVCRLWGFFVYELWGNSSILGYFVIRVFLAGAIYLSGFIGIPISPLRVLYHLNASSGLSENVPIQPYTVYMLMAFGSIVVLTVLCEWWGRHQRRKQMAQ